jgi:cytochrome c-type biogenesis protein CcmH/NrfG
MSISRLCLILAFVLSCPLLNAGLNQEADLQEQLRRTQQLIIDGKLLEARQKLEGLAGTYPQDPRVHNLLGVIQAQTGDYKSAESSLIKAIDLYPRYTGALLNLGRLYQENLGGDQFAREKGIAIYTRLLGYEPENIEANFQIAVLLHLGQDFAGSQEHLSKLPAVDQARAMAKIVICANHAALGHANRADELARELVGDLQEETTWLFSYSNHWLNGMR